MAHHLENSLDDQLYSYEPFAQHAFYTAVNRTLVEQALAHLSPSLLPQPPTIVDLGCGTGAVTRLIVEALRASGAAGQGGGH
jgi:trans-aconitate methyltransferase